MGRTSSAGPAGLNGTQRRRPAEAVSTYQGVRTQYPIMGQPGSFQRAAVNGRVRRPKLETDQRRLMDLLAYCRQGNLRETRAIVAHHPFLLTFTDQYGMTALHHAEMSGDPSFVAQVLAFYRNPRSFVAKQLQYDTEEEMLADYADGLFIRREVDESLGAAVVVVRCVGEDTLAKEAGIMVGDMLETLGGASFLGSRQPPPAGTDILDALRAGRPGSSGFPLTLEFRGSACQEILGRDGWTPAHAAAGYGGKKHAQIQQLLLDEEGEGHFAKDHVGCTAEDWARIHRDTVSRKQRRPLSAGLSGRPTSALSRPGSASRVYAAVAAASVDAGLAFEHVGAQSSAAGSRKSLLGGYVPAAPKMGPPPGMAPPSAAAGGDAPPAPAYILSEAMCPELRAQHPAFCRPLSLGTGGGKGYGARPSGRALVC